MLFIGFYLRNKEADSESFYLDERSLCTAHTTASSFSTFLGAGLVFTMASFGYIYGISILLILIALLAGMAVFLYTSGDIKERSSSNSSITLPQVMESEWNEKTKLAASLLIITIFIATLSSNFMIAGEILKSVFGLDRTLGIVSFGILVILYTLMSGFKGVKWTDAIQMVIIFIGIISLLGLGINRWSLFYSKIPSGHLSLSGIPPKILIGFVMVGFFASYGSQDLFQRIFASKNPKSVKKGLTIFSFMIGILLLSSLLLGIIARGLLPNIAADQALPLLTVELAGSGISGIILAAFLSLANSSADSQLLSISSNISEDFELLQNRDDLTVFRFLITVVGVFSLIVAVLVPSLVDLAGAVGSWFAILGFVVFSSLYWKKSTEKAAFYSLVGGFTGAIITGVSTSNLQISTLAGLIPSIIIMISVSLWDR